MSADGNRSESEPLKPLDSPSDTAEVVELRTYDFGTSATKGKLAAFIREFEARGVISHAAAEVGISRDTIRLAKQADEAFALDFADADERVTERLEREMMRRATDGVIRGVYHKGELVGQERHYSDTLLIFALKARRPEKYRERVEISGSLDVEREKSKRKSDEELDRDLGGIADG